MSNRIYTELKDIEQKKNIKIILAVEVGSRIYGYMMPGSDYDVRFIYVRKPEDYLKLTKSKDTIEIKKDDLDIIGWDLKKALELLYNSNASLYQWFMSPKVHIETEESIELRKLLPKYFSLKKMLYQYTSMAYNAFPEPCELEETVIIKNYLRKIHSIMIAQYIAKHESIPPITFDALLPVNTFFTPSAKERIKDIISLRHSKRKIMPTDMLLNHKYVSDMLFELDEYIHMIKHEKKDWCDLNKFFAEVVLKEVRKT